MRGGAELADYTEFYDCSTVGHRKGPVKPVHVLNLVNVLCFGRA